VCACHRVGLFIEIAVLAFTSGLKLKRTEMSAPPLFVAHLSTSWCRAVRPTKSLMKGVSNLNRSDTRQCVRRLIESGAQLTGAGRRRDRAKQSPTSGALVQWCVSFASVRVAQCRMARQRYANVYGECLDIRASTGLSSAMSNAGIVHPTIRVGLRLQLSGIVGTVPKALNLARTRAASQLGSTPFFLSCATWQWHQCALESNRFGLDWNAAKRT